MQRYQSHADFQLSQIKMLKLVVLSAIVAAATAAVYPTLNSYRQYPTRPPPTYNPLPSYAPAPSYTPTYAPTYNTQSPGRYIAILRADNEIAPDGSQYRYAYETENGIAVQESGAIQGSGPDAAIAASGSYQYTSPEGVPVQVSYIADANGFQPAGNVLPTPPPIPPAILRSLEYNAAHPEPVANVPYGRNYYQ